MKTIVIYTSKTGFTEQYAQHIAKRLGCEALPLPQATPERVADCDTVLYGGWIFANQIRGLRKLRPLCKGRLLVFAVGATPPAKMDLEALRAANGLPEGTLFYLEGGFRFERLGFFTRWMLKKFGSMAAKKETADGQGQMLADLSGASYDHTDMNAAEPLIAAVQR